MDNANKILDWLFVTEAGADGDTSEDQPRNG